MNAQTDDFANLPLTGPEGLQAEYVALREELLKRIEARQQILSLSLTIAGAYLGVGWGSGTAVALLLYPPIAALLAAGWAQNEVLIGQLSRYIRDHLESALPGLGWEHYRRARQRETSIAGWPIDVLATGGIFLLTQLIAVLLGFFRLTEPNALAWILLVVDAAAILALLVLLEYVRRHNRM